MLIKHAVESGLARVSDSTSTNRTTGHTISYCTVFFRTQHRIVRQKIQATTPAQLGVYLAKITILRKSLFQNPDGTLNIFVKL